MNLAVKYRPKDFCEVSSQEIIIKMLEKQLETKEYFNCILLCGGSGCGKTTIARIFANKINNNCGLPEEIDAASNNGVDNIRNIISSAKERSIDSQYKVFIIDEAHMITTQGWNAFLKCLEEPPKYSIFIFCTTDSQKIPSTIQNRMVIFNLTPVDPSLIEQRLNYICQQENFLNYSESTKYISKIVNGSMRKAISNLEKISNYSQDISLENTLKVLGDYSYNVMFNLTNAIIDSQDIDIVNIIEDLENKGGNLKIFLDQYLNFILDLNKYCLTKNIDATKIPNTEIEKLDYTINIENNVIYFKKLLNRLFEIKEILKFDNNIKTTLTIKLLQLTKGA